jgi:hypothetical protein
MPLIALDPGTLATSGIDIGSESLLGLDPPDAILTSGVPISINTTASVVSPTPSPDTVRTRVLDENGTFICHLPHAFGTRWLSEHNTPGAGSVDISRYDDIEDDHPGVWAPGNQIIISVGSLDVFRIVFDTEPGYRIETSGQRTDSWAGLGALGILNTGMVEPEYGWRAEATDQRSFDYGSNPTLANWVVPSEWVTPVGKPVRKSWRWTYKKHHYPKGFPTKGAQWLWYRNPDSKSSANEVCYFRRSFTLTQARRVKFWVCGDDTLEFQLDGEVRLTAGPGGWKKASTFVMNLSAGTHYVAAKVSNNPGSTGNQNRSGFLCAIARLDGDGEVTKWIDRSSPSNWLIRRQRSTAPGWHAAQVVLQLAEEQRLRGCASHSGLTYGFTSSRDSASVGWVDRQERSLAVGTLGLDWLQQIQETGLDVAMSPSLRLYLWRRRGTDRSNTIRLDQGTAHALDETGTAPPAIRNVGYARARSGWVGRTEAASVAARGRRETMITLGSSRSSTQTAAALASMLPDMATTPQTIEVRLSAVSGPQPFRHFDVADWVSYRASGQTTWARYRVMSIGGETNDAGLPDWTVTLQEDPR